MIENISRILTVCAEGGILRMLVEWMKGESRHEAGNGAIRLQYCGSKQPTHS